MVGLGISQLGSAGVIQAKANLAPLLIERAWERTQLASGKPVKPWSWADTWPVARLSVPTLAIDQLVLAGDTGNALAFGPGHALGSADLGSAGVAVIGGHRDTHFSFLKDLSVGEYLVLELPSGEKRSYRIAHTAIVDSRDDQLVGEEGLSGERFQYPPLQSSTERLMLVTCYPFDALRAGGPLRYVVTATRASHNAT